MAEPHSSNFRVITTNFLGVRIFGKFTVIPLKDADADHDQTAPLGAVSDLGLHRSPRTVSPKKLGIIVAMQFKGTRSFN